MNAYTDLTLKLRAGRRNFRDTDVRRLLCEMEALRATNAKLRQGQAEAVTFDLREPVNICGEEFVAHHTEHLTPLKRSGGKNYMRVVPVIVYTEKKAR